MRERGDLGPSLYGFQLAAFLDHFDRSQVLVIASEVLRDRPREALSQVFDHLAVDPAAVDLDERLQDHRSLDKPVPRLHDLKWLPRRQVELPVLPRKGAVLPGAVLHLPQSCVA